MIRRARGWSWADLPVRAKALITLAIPILSMLAMGLTALYGQRQEHASERSVRHSYEVRSKMEALYTALVSAETSVRGFLLTRDPDFLDPYLQAQKTIPALLAQLNALAQAPEIQARLPRFADLVARRTGQWASLVEENGSGATTGDLTARLRMGRETMRELRGVLEGMIADEERIVTMRAQDHERLRVSQRRLLAGGLVLGVLGGSAATLLLSNGIVRRAQRLEAAAGALAAGEPLDVKMRGGNDEIGRVYDAMRRASALLVERERALHQAIARTRDLYDNAPCGYHSLAADGSFREINATELAWLGYTREEIIGRPFPEVLTPESRADFQRRFPLFKKEGSLQDTEFELVRKDGTILPVSITATIIRDEAGAFVGTRSTLFDITERRSAQARLAELHAALERRLGAETALNQELAAFSYSVSHDLRAPLRSIDGFSQALLEDYHQQLDATGRNYLERVRAAAQRMAQLIDDILLLSRVTRADLRAAPVNLTTLAHEIATTLQDQEPSRRVEWRIEPELTGAGDAQLLRVALENLLGNAWKFTGKRAEGVIEFGRASDNGTFVVRDNGAGFDMAYAGKLFGAFQRLHAAGDFAGTGIGLATVQRIVTKHGGRIWAEGEIDRGAAFYFTLGPDGGTDDGKRHDSAG